MKTFLIRDLFWATTIAALALGWFMHWASSHAQYESLLKEHLQTLNRQSDTSMAGTTLMFQHMHERGELQRQYMEEKKKGIMLKAEFSNRLVQELNKARRADAARLRATAGQSEPNGAGKQTDAEKE